MTIKLTALLSRRSCFHMIALTTVGMIVPLRPATVEARTHASEWSPGDGLNALTAGDEHRFQADFPTNALMVHWAREGSPADVMVEVAVSQDGRNWSDWTLAPVDEDTGGQGPAERAYTGAIMVDTSRHVRLRLINRLGQSGQPVVDLRVAYLNTLAGPETSGLSASGAREDTLAATELQASALNVVSRAAWGADENLRFLNGRERWPRQHRVPEKIVLHHTETSNTQDPMAGIRAVYYFHAVTRGWGDIGYNYVIDRFGRIYEGRTGGDNVIGGHALQYNPGSIGIAVLGSFKTVGITPRTEEAIVALIAEKGRAIDPIGQSWFVDKMLANISGHRDCLSTACPGDAFYPRLPSIRQKVLERIGYRPTKVIEITDVRVTPAELRTGDKLEVAITVKNTGTAVLPSDPRGPGIVYTEGQDYAARGLPKVTGKFRVALEIVGGSGGRYPYRWGLGRAILPNESITVTGSVQMTQPRNSVVQVALIEEFIGYWQQDVGATRVTVTGQPVNVTPINPEPEPEEDPQPKPLPTERIPPPDGPEAHRTYFPETGHYLAWGFRAYWEQNGGLAQFGLPLTSEFIEVNPADGKEYMVQYFERARFEYHPEHKGTPYEVLLGLLGNQMTVGRTFSKAPSTARPSADAQYFPETQQWVSGSILRHWRDNGGLMMYGYPISPAFEERNPDDGQTYLVQYFERNRFEYHPQHQGTPYEVQLGHLGRQVLVDRGWLNR